VMHVMLGVIQYETNPVFIIIMAAGAAVLILLHLIAGIKETHIDNLQLKLQQDGFTYVCDAGEIEESRANIFCLEKERIAVYKHENKLYAIHNVCKHQGGPLGEGKIIDGCITCPWHGYQYLPHNGQSPPPFKEAVSTYDVKVLNGKVWLNPAPYPEGSEKRGAIIN
jgi:methionine sulfoxide reductase heme-binding subunit